MLIEIEIITKKQMISSIKLKLISIAEIAHLRIFGHEMGEEMRKFLGHLSWSFFGGMIAAGMLLILNILAGRWLGPVEYGKYGLVVAISAIFIIPMTLGIDTAITYFVSKSKTAFEKKEIVASSLWLVGLFIAAVVLIASFFSQFLASIFNAQKEIIEVAIFFSIFLAMRNILDAVIKGLHLFKFQSIIRIAEALIVIVSFYIFFETYGRFGFRSYVFAILAGYVFTISAILWTARKKISFDSKYTKKILSYGMFAIVGSLFGIMTNSFDKILINKYIGQEQLGIYNAYATASFLLVTQIMTLFINVFFPYLSSIKDDGSILKKLNRLARIFCIPVFLILSFIIWFIILSFGKAYGLDWILLGEFSFFGVITMYFTALWWLIASRGINGIQFTSLNGIIAGLMFLFLMFVFNNMLNLYFVVLFLIFSILYAVIIGNLMYARIK